MKRAYIVGRKIYLRPLERDDLENGYAEWVNDMEVNKYLACGCKPISMSELKEFYEKIINSGTDIMFAIVAKKTDRYIGNVKIGEINWVNRTAHFGRMIGDKRYWNKGYGTEVLKLIISYTFNTLNLNRLFTTIVEDNIAAIKSCKKLGMKKEGVFSQAKFMDGEYKNVVQLAITRNQYDRLKGNRQHG